MTSTRPDRAVRSKSHTGLSRTLTRLILNPDFVSLPCINHQPVMQSRLPNKSNAWLRQRWTRSHPSEHGYDVHLKLSPNGSLTMQSRPSVIVGGWSGDGTRPDPTQIVSPTVELVDMQISSLIHPGRNTSGLNCLRPWIPGTAGESQNHCSIQSRQCTSAQPTNSNNFAKNSLIFSLTKYHH